MSIWYYWYLWVIVAFKVKMALLLFSGPSTREQFVATVLKIAIQFDHAHLSLIMSHITQLNTLMSWKNMADVADSPKTWHSHDSALCRNYFFLACEHASDTIDESQDDGYETSKMGICTNLVLTLSLTEQLQLARIHQNTW